MYKLILQSLMIVGFTLIWPTLTYAIPKGTYLIQKKEPLILQNFKIIFKTQDSLNDAVLLTRSHSTKPIENITTTKGFIRNLTFKNKEYIYGQIKLPYSSKIYRCKLWQKTDAVFLRVYGPFTYHTYKLKWLSW